MAQNQRVSESDRNRLRSDFERTLQAVEAAFGDYAFRRYFAETDEWKNQVLASLFDAQMFACRGRDPAILMDRFPAIVFEMKRLQRDADFRRAIDAATNTPGSFIARIEAVSKMLDRVTN